MDKLKFLLVGIDFSPRSNTAAQLAVTLAKQTNATVEMMHVVEARITEADAEVLGLSREEIEQAETKEASVELDALAEQLDYDKIQTRVASGYAAESLTKRYQEADADILLIGDVGAQSPEPRYGPGITAYRLVESGPENVLVVKPSYLGVLDRIAAAVDFSPVSDDVMKQAVLIAKLTGAHLFAVHVFSMPYTTRVRRLFGKSAVDEAVRRIRDEDERRLSEFLRRFEDNDVPIEPVVLAGPTSSALLEYLQHERIDLVAVGTGTSPRVAGFPIGSTTHAVINQTLASVFVVRAL